MEREIIDLCRSSQGPSILKAEGFFFFAGYQVAGGEEGVTFLSRHKELIGTQRCTTDERLVRGSGKVVAVYEHKVKILFYSIFSFFLPMFVSNSLLS